MANFHLKLKCLLGGVIVLVSPIRAEEAPESGSLLQKGWLQTSRFLFREAHETFTQSPANTKEEERNRLLGLAVTQLGLQPRTQGNIHRAETTLRDLIAENPSDAAGLLARFYLARILELHSASPDPEAAREIYHELLLERSGHPLIELAAARVAFHDLYAAGNDPAALTKAENGLRPLAEVLQTPSGIREFHTAVGFTLNDLGGDRKTALEHMKIASNIPNALPQMQTANLLLTAELAKSLEQWDVAREFYTRFVDGFKRDNRNYSVRRILETLPEGKDGAGS